MPHSFQTNDERRSAPHLLEPASRVDVALPAEAFVFSTFNNTYKLNPAMVDSWGLFLDQVPRSVLWLLGETPKMRLRLTQEATARGLDPTRLILASRDRARAKHGTLDRHPA